VIQADRDAAADYVLSTDHWTMKRVVAGSIQAGGGDMDKAPLVQAFARHRLSEYARGLEDAAKWHDGRAERYREVRLTRRAATHAYSAEQIRTLKDQPQ
jgi:hypothetical protein